MLHIPNSTPPASFIFTHWRHGGWYVNNVRYPSGAIGCVSRNYPDRKWRIVCDPRPNAPTFLDRNAAALAEWHLINQVNTATDTEPQNLLTDESFIASATKDHSTLITSPTMKTLAEFIAFYSAIHIARIQKEIAKQDPVREERYIEMLRTKELPSWQPDSQSLIDRCTQFYNSLITKQPQELCRFDCLSINKTIWKTVAYTLGIPAFKTQKQVDAWIREYYGENYTAWLNQIAEADTQKREAARITQEQRYLEVLIENANRLKYHDGVSIHQNTVKLYQEGYRISLRKQGFAEVKIIANASTNTFLVKQRAKNYQAKEFYSTVYAYFEHYQAEQEKLNLTPQEEEPIDPEIERLFKIPTNTITDRFPLLKKFVAA